MTDSHSTRDAPRSSRDLDDRGERDPEAAAIPSSARSWRSGSQGTRAAVMPLEVDENGRAAEHQTRGRRDARRTFDEPVGVTTAPAVEVIGHEDHHQAEDPVGIDNAPAPTRPRQGFTGKDPARPSRFRTIFTIRKFDQNAARHPGAVVKAPEMVAGAHLAPTRGRQTGGRPSPAGFAGTGMTPIGVQRNTFRRAPGSWDTDLVNRGTTAPAVTEASRRSSGWRGR